MKTKPLLFQIGLLSANAVLLAGCSSTEQYYNQAKMNPSLAGGALRVDTRKVEATVEAIDPSQRTIVLKAYETGASQYRVSNGVMNLDQVPTGAEVKAKLVDEDALFLGGTPVPPAGPGVCDFKTKIWNLDRSYRLITLVYPNNETRDFKVPLGTPLENVNPGDEAVVRSTVPMVVQLKPN
jgi:hypothetical protein